MKDSWLAGKIFVQEYDRLCKSLGVVKCLFTADSTFMKYTRFSIAPLPGHGSAVSLHFTNLEYAVSYTNSL